MNKLTPREPTPYGRCPICGANGVLRERRPNGNDKCANGHTYPSKSAMHDAAPSAEPVAEESRVELAHAVSCAVGIITDITSATPSMTEAELGASMARIEKQCEWLLSIATQTAEPVADEPVYGRWCLQPDRCQWQAGGAGCKPCDEADTRPAAAPAEQLRRGITGVCTKGVCECEREGYGDRCIWLRPTDAELERRFGEPHIDGYPLYSGLPPPPAESGEYPPLPDELRTMRDLGRVAGPDTVERLMRAYVDADRAQRVPLTEAEILKSWGLRSDGPDNHEIISFARAIERAHGIGAKP